jgi:hypothetical protein
MGLTNPFKPFSEWLDFPNNKGESPGSGRGVVFTQRMVPLQALLFQTPAACHT